MITTTDEKRNKVLGGGMMKGTCENNRISIT